MTKTDWSFRSVTASLTADISEAPNPALDRGQKEISPERLSKSLDISLHLSDLNTTLSLLVGVTYKSGVATAKQSELSVA